MRLISRHILRSLMPPFFWGVAALTGLLLLNALPPLIDTFGGKGLSASLMFEGVLLFLPALLALTLPMAVLVSTLYGYSQLAAALEMVAMYANGISVWRMARPALVAAAVVAVVNFAVFDQLVPQSNIRFKALQQAAAIKTPTLALQQQVLNVLPPTEYVLRADRIDPETGGLVGVTIFDLTGLTGARRLIVSDSGTMAESPTGEDLILTLHTGQIYEFKLNEPGRLQQTNFVNTRVVIRNVQNNLNLNIRSNPGEREKSSCELLDAVTNESWSAALYREQAEDVTRNDLRSLIGLPQLLGRAARTRPVFPPHCGRFRQVEDWLKRVLMPPPLAAQTPQQTPPQHPVTPAPGPVPQAPAPVQANGLLQPGMTPLPTTQGLRDATTGMPSTPSMVSYTVSTLRQTEEMTRRYQVEYHQKFAIPLSSFCFVLIGMALALKYPGSGIGLVIGGSLVIFLGFYIMLQGGKGIATAGGLNPAVALYAPLVLFTIIGLFAVSSANREMGSVRSTGVFTAIADFFRNWKD